MSVSSYNLRYAQPGDALHKGYFLQDFTSQTCNIYQSMIHFPSFLLCSSEESPVLCGKSLGEYSPVLENRCGIAERGSKMGWEAFVESFDCCFRPDSKSNYVAPPEAIKDNSERSKRNSVTMTENSSWVRT